MYKCVFNLIICHMSIFLNFAYKLISFGININGKFMPNNLKKQLNTSGDLLYFSLIIFNEHSIMARPT